MVVCLGLDDQSFYSSDSIGNRACKALGDAIITAPLGIASATFGKESLEVETFKQFPQNLDRNKELGKHEKENETQGAEYPIPSEEKGEN
jgi:hypothetical protein